MSDTDNSPYVIELRIVASGKYARWIVNMLGKYLQTLNEEIGAATEEELAADGCVHGYELHATKTTHWWAYLLVRYYRLRTQMLIAEKQLDKWIEDTWARLVRRKGSEDA
jgi:hypothetical protein